MSGSLPGLLARIAGALGDDRLLGPEARGPSPGIDLCGYALGQPLAWVRPRSAAEVAQLVGIARATQTPLVPVGRRTAYWRPLRLEAAIALDISGLDRLQTPDLEAGYFRCGAGAEVRAVDEALRGHGAVLASFPDAFGDTSIGAMVAGGFVSGIGMGNGTFASTLVGLTVVLGTGEVLSTGAGQSLAASPFIRPGLPDPTELFLASDGALGVITEVVIRPHRQVPLAQLTWRGPPGRAGLRAAVELARRLRRPGLYETFRAATVFEAGDGAAGPLEVDLAIPAPLGVGELGERVRAIQALAARVFPGAAFSEQREIPGQPGRIDLRSFRNAKSGDHWRQMAANQFAGVDVIVPYGEQEACFDAALEIVADARRLPTLLGARCALYFAPDFINLGLHLELRREGPEAAAAAHSLVARAMLCFAPLRVTPYRWGRLWEPALGAKLDPVYRAFLLDLKRRCDPQGILHSGASIFGGARTS